MTRSPRMMPVSITPFGNSFSRAQPFGEKGREYIGFVVICEHDDYIHQGFILVMRMGTYECVLLQDLINHIV